MNLALVAAHVLVVGSNVVRVDLVTGDDAVGLVVGVVAVLVTRSVGETTNGAALASVLAGNLRGKELGVEDVAANQALARNLLQRVSVHTFMDSSGGELT